MTSKKNQTSNDQPSTSAEDPSPVFDESLFDGDEEDEWQDVRAPYWHVDHGSFIQGTFIEKHLQVKSKFGPRDLIDVRLDKPTIVAAGKKKTATLAAGNVCRIAYRNAMGPILDMLEPGDGIAILVTGKTPTDKGNDAWTFKVKRRAAKKSAKGSEVENHS